MLTLTLPAPSMTTARKGPSPRGRLRVDQGVGLLHGHGWVIDRVVEQSGRLVVVVGHFGARTDLGD
ncbi:Uncharacterised protein [Mycobacterium tuberculosis]|nr:Uncharacterised protein [Mycobacterium tuberculosis]